MREVVKILKKVGKVVIRIGIVILMIVLVFSNRSLKKENNKQKLIIKNYEQHYFGSEKDISELENDEMESLKQNIISLQKSVEELEKQKGKLTTQKQNVMSDVNVEESVKEYLTRKFPFDGNYYKEAGEAQYYKDIFCTKKIDSKNLRFMSQTTDYTSAENGLSVTCILTSDWQIIYCTESPYLVTEEKYQEINYQK